MKLVLQEDIRVHDPRKVHDDKNDIKFYVADAAQICPRKILHILWERKIRSKLLFLVENIANKSLICLLNY